MVGGVVSGEELLTKKGNVYPVLTRLQPKCQYRRYLLYKKYDSPSAITTDNTCIIIQAGQALPIQVKPYEIWLDPGLGTVM